MSFSSSLFFPLVPYCVFLFLFHCEYIFKWRKIPGFSFFRWVAIRQNGTSDWLCVYVSECDTEAWTRKKCCVFIVSARSTEATGYDLFFILFFTKHLFSAMMMMALCASKLTTFYPLSCWTKIKWIFAAALPLHPILLQYFFFLFRLFIVVIAALYAIKIYTSSVQHISKGIYGKTEWPWIRVMQTAAANVCQMAMPAKLVENWTLQPLGQHCTLIRVTLIEPTIFMSGERSFFGTKKQKTKKILFFFL